ncbi:14256_t:CDS:10 [Funneliformis geosporum]|nr:14256_t:CDS:10 [Funneliformis geosporum]
MNKDLVKENEELKKQIAELSKFKHERKGGSKKKTLDQISTPAHISEFMRDLVQEGQKVHSETDIDEEALELCKINLPHAILFHHNSLECNTPCQIQEHIFYEGTKLEKVEDYQEKIFVMNPPFSLVGKMTIIDLPSCTFSPHVEVGTIILQLSINEPSEYFYKFNIKNDGYTQNKRREKNDVFSTDYSLVPETLALLTNYQAELKHRMVLLTIRKEKGKERVIEMEVLLIRRVLKERRQYDKYCSDLKIPGRSNGNCQHPEGDYSTCGKYENSLLLTPAGGNQIAVPTGYSPRKKAQEQSLKLAQFYTPECLVELCLELLKPTGELFDPCCGLGSFLLKAKTKDENLKISGNDIATDLVELPFEFTNSDYLTSEDKEYDYIIANIPFNSKKTHCQLQLIKHTYELRYSLHALIADAYQKLMLIEELDDSGEIRVDYMALENLQLPQTLFFSLGDLFFQKYQDSQIIIKDHFKLVRGKTPPTKNPEYYENGTIKEF